MSKDKTKKALRNDGFKDGEIVRLTDELKQSRWAMETSGEYVSKLLAEIEGLKVDNNAVKAACESAAAAAAGLLTRAETAEAALAGFKADMNAALASVQAAGYAVGVSASDEVPSPSEQA